VKRLQRCCSAIKQFIFSALAPLRHPERVKVIYQYVQPIHVYAKFRSGSASVRRGLARNLDGPRRLIAVKWRLIGRCRCADGTEAVFHKCRAVGVRRLLPSALFR